RAAGGYMLQLLPDVGEEDIDEIEKVLGNAKPISTLIDEGLKPEDVMEELFGQFEMEILDKVPREYKCNCERDRIEKLLLGIGKEELYNIIEEDGQAEIVCHFCNEKYQFSKDDLLKLIDY